MKRVIGMLIEVEEDDLEEVSEPLEAVARREDTTTHFFLSGTYAFWRGLVKGMGLEDVFRTTTVAMPATEPTGSAYEPPESEEEE